MAATRPYSNWQRWLSYVTDITLEEGAGDHTEHLEVILRKGKVLLQADGAVYSWEDRYYNFAYAFEHLRWELLPGTRCLLLGLGLGSVPQLIEERNGKQLTYTAIEYDEVVAALAEEFLLYRLSSPITTIVADAGAFVAQDHGTYDLILIDLFVDAVVPEQFCTRDFLESLKRRLAPGGLVISNRLTYTDDDKIEAMGYFEHTFSEVFAEAAFLDVRTNWMLYSDGSFLIDPEAD